MQIENDHKTKEKKWYYSISPSNSTKVRSR